MKRRIPLLLLGSLLCSAFSVTYSFAQCSDIGIYYWGGSLTTTDSATIIPAAKKLADSLHINTIRIVLECFSDEDYCYTPHCLENSNLTALASRADFNSIITDPQFSTIIITAYDWVSSSNCYTYYFLDTSFYTPSNILAMENEYTNFANYLKTFPTKQFIISQWEADNQCYCGSACCDTSCPYSKQAIAAFTKWMNVRAAGIHAANAPNVKIGIEFNNIHSLEDAGLPDILDTVIPYVYSDYYLYSSWESLNVSIAQTASDIEFIRQKLARFGKDSSALLFGEMGYGASAFGSDSAAAKLGRLINMLNQYHIPIGIVWTLLDNPTDYGAYDSTGALTQNGAVIKNYVCNAASATDAKIGNTLQLSVTPNPNDGLFLLSFTCAGNDNYSIEIRNVLGQLLYSEELPNFDGLYDKEISMRSSLPGVYFIVVRNSSTIVTKKVILY